MQLGNGSNQVEAYLSLPCRDAILFSKFVGKTNEFSGQKHSFVFKDDRKYYE